MRTSCRVWRIFHLRRIRRILFPLAFGEAGSGELLAVAAILNEGLFEGGDLLVEEELLAEPIRGVVDDRGGLETSGRPVAAAGTGCKGRIAGQARADASARQACCLALTRQAIFAGLGGYVTGL